MNFPIQDYIQKELSIEEREVALTFVDYLEKLELEFIKDEGYWRDKIYYLVNYKGKGVCFISIKDPEEKGNHWTIWSDDRGSLWLENDSVDNELKNTAWEHIDFCGNCGSCGGGRHKVIFGKEFDNVCGCTFRIDNPEKRDLPFLKKMVEIRMQEIETFPE